MELVDSIVKGIQEKKGQHIVVCNLQGIDGAICNYFVICQGQSPTQVGAICDSVEETARVEAGEKPIKIIGVENAQWIAMDYGDAMVHIFLPEERQYYDLEHLWDDAELTEIAEED
jgi:ribosome-associated protein